MRAFSAQREGTGSVAESHAHVVLLSLTVSWYLLAKSHGLPCRLPISISH